MNEFITIESPDGSLLEFPASMSMDEIKAVMQKKFPPATAQADPIRAEAEAMANRYEQVWGQGGAGRLFQNQFALGLADKITGGVEGVAEMLRGGSFGQGYKRGSLAEQILEERARERSGASGTAAEIAGTISTGLLAKAPAALGALGRVGQTAKEAAMLGTIQGAGDSTKDSLGGIAGDALTSGGVSALFGGALQGGMEIAKPIIKGGRAIGRAVGSLADNTEGRAARKVVKALADDGLTPQRAVGRMERAQTNLAGVSSVSDGNVMGLGREASKQIGPGRNIMNRALDKQQAARADIVVETVNKTLGGGDVPFNRRVAKMISERGQTAKGAYEKAWKLNFGGNHSKKFDNIARRVPASALRDAQLIARLDDVPFGQQLVASIDDASGMVNFSRRPSLREWHYIQQGLRSSTGSAFSEGRGAVGTAYKGLHKELLEAMDEANGLYKVARKSYATESQLIEALQRGRDILKPATLNNLDQFADDFASMSKPEREMIRTGLARALEDMVYSTPSEAGNAVKKIFGTPQKRAAIRSVFESASDFRKFEVRMGQLMREADPFYKIRTGSRTEFSSAEGQGFGALNEASDAAVAMATGGVNLNSTMRGAAKLIGKLGQMDEAQAAAIAKLMTEKDPQIVLRALSAKQGTVAGNQAIDAFLTKAAQLARAGIVGGSAGAGGAIVSAQ